MSLMPTIVSIISILGCLFLVSRSSAFQGMCGSDMIRMALIWGVIIVGLLLVVQMAGLQLGS